MPDEDKTFSGFLVLDLRIWWHQVHTLYMTKIRSKFGEQQLVMMNYACGFNQSETGKYF